MHLERTTSELELKSEKSKIGTFWTTSELELKSDKSKIGTFCLEFNGQVLARHD